MRKKLIPVLFVAFLMGMQAKAGDKYNFNSDWRLSVGDTSAAQNIHFADNGWKLVTLPHAFNEDEAFKVQIAQMTDTIAWYRKHFKLPASAKGKKYSLNLKESARLPMSM